MRRGFPTTSHPLRLLPHMDVTWEGGALPTFRHGIYEFILFIVQKLLSDYKLTSVYESNIGLI